MSRFSRLHEFERELKRLARKYRSLPDDVLFLEKIIVVEHCGTGTNFVMLHNGEQVKIVKARLTCHSLKRRSLRLVYAYHPDTDLFVHLELYFKGDKENEDRERIKAYLKTINDSKGTSD